jgi:exodeoxyribonuclease-5
MSIFADEFYNQLKNKFGLAPTSQQDILMQKLSLFINQKEKNSLFLLKGYAGTGKTTVISALVSLLREKNTHIVLLAPTGRAAKVISNISKNVAHTIHRRIYLATRDSAGNIKLKLQKNKLKNAIFIVDEASMIPDYKPGSRDLLSDLMKFVYEFEFNKTIFIGDTAQLPPVGLEVSPALDLKYLKSNFNLNVFTIELTEVIRQAEKSGILKNANCLFLIWISLLILKSCQVMNFKRNWNLHTIIKDMKKLC